MKEKFWDREGWKLDYYNNENLTSPEEISADIKLLSNSESRANRMWMKNVSLVKTFNLLFFLCYI